MFPDGWACNTCLPEATPRGANVNTKGEVNNEELPVNQPIIEKNKKWML